MKTARDYARDIIERFRGFTFDKHDLEDDIVEAVEAYCAADGAPAVAGRLLSDELAAKIVDRSRNGTKPEIAHLDVSMLLMERRVLLGIINDMAADGKVEVYNAGYAAGRKAGESRRRAEEDRR